MSRQKEAAFLVDCLGHMPEQTGEIKIAVDTVIAGLTLIVNGQEWSRDEVSAAWAAAWAAAGEELKFAAEAAADAATWAAAADWAADCAENWAAACAAAADWAAAAAASAAKWAARAHPDPDAERSRQEKVREKLGLNTKQEAD